MSGDDQVFEQLAEFKGTEAVILGIGNILKGDDGAGPRICEQIKGKVCAEVIDCGTVPENYIQSIIKKAPQSLLIIDAVHFAASPGAIRVFETEQLSSVVISTHTLSPRFFVELIRQSISVEVCLIGIQPVQTQLGEPVSAQVDQAIEQLANMLRLVFPGES